MAKARAIVKRRKAVRNIRKITKTMQMIATAKFQKALKRGVAAKPYTRKTRELVAELAASVGDVDHPLLRRPGPDEATNRIALVTISSNRGLCRRIQRQRPSRRHRIYQASDYRWQNRRPLRRRQEGRQLFQLPKAAPSPSDSINSATPPNSPTPLKSPIPSCGDSSPRKSTPSTSPT